jgi:hypothetical protein
MLKRQQMGEKMFEPAQVETAIGVLAAAHPDRPASTSGALRRSELVALNVQDVAFEGKGMVLTIRRSTDPEAAGQLVGILHGPFSICSCGCPIAAFHPGVKNRFRSSEHTALLLN